MFLAATDLHIHTIELVSLLYLCSWIGFSIKNTGYSIEEDKE